MGSKHIEDRPEQCFVALLTIGEKETFQFITFFLKILCSWAMQAMLTGNFAIYLFQYSWNFFLVRFVIFGRFTIAPGPHDPHPLMHLLSFTQVATSVDCLSIRLTVIYFQVNLRFHCMLKQLAFKTSL